MRTANYNLNSANLNQYGNRSTPASIDIIGLGNPSATVTINTSPADYRRGEYFWENLGLTTGANPLWQSVSVDAGGTPVTGNLLIPPATQSFTYDLDGNLTSDGLWTYYYDAENRLYRIENPTTLSPISARKKLVFEYDHLGRRIRKQLYLWATSDYSGTATTDTKFFYNAWNLIKETTGTAWKAYMWGLDLSGTTDGAGGVGGLLLFNDSALGASFVSYDGNGNAVKLLKVTDSTTTADYEYDSFGQVIRMSGSSAAANPVHFSSKYHDSETDLLSYGFRFYAPLLGRWLSRDPIGENGGLNLFGFLNNSPANFFDALGEIIYARGHIISGTGWKFGGVGPATYAHMSLKIVPLDQCYWANRFPFKHKDHSGNWYATVGAGPIPRNPVAAKVVSDFNREYDLDPADGGDTKINSEVVFNTNDLEEDNIMVLSILVLMSHFPKNLDYDYFPNLKAATGWNSNSFIHGLLLADPWFKPPTFPVSNALYEGWPKPIPSKYFY